LRCQMLCKMWSLDVVGLGRMRGGIRPGRVSERRRRNGMLIIGGCAAVLSLRL
jgi:hypothetical protein